MEQITKMRNQFHMSQVMLGNLLGVTRYTIMSWERGETTPNAEQIKKMAEVFGVTPNDILI